MNKIAKTDTMGVTEGTLRNAMGQEHTVEGGSHEINFCYFHENYGIPKYGSVHLSLWLPKELHPHTGVLTDQHTEYGAVINTTEDLVV